VEKTTANWQQNPQNRKAKTPAVHRKKKGTGWTKCCGEKLSVKSCEQDGRQRDYSKKGKCKTQRIRIKEKARLQNSLDTRSFKSNALGGKKKLH